MLTMNFNDQAYVTLTEHALALHREYHRQVLGKHGFRYEPPTTDDEGRSKFQLWELMRLFGGKHIYMGGPQLFVENKIEFAAR